jgi:hypothetical protein
MQYIIYLVLNLIHATMVVCANNPLSAHLAPLPGALAAVGLVAAVLALLLAVAPLRDGVTFGAAKKVVLAAN